MSSEMDLNTTREYGNSYKPQKLKLSIKRKRGDSRGDSIDRGSIENPSVRNAP